MKSSLITGTQEPEGTDPPAGHLQMTNIVDNLERYVVSRFASASARAAAIPTPTEGMVSYLADTDSLDIFDGSSWQTARRQQVTVSGGRKVPYYSFRVWRAAAHPIGAGGWSDIFYDTDDWDPAGQYSEGGFWQVPVTGTWLVQAVLPMRFDSSGANQRSAIALRDSAGNELTRGTDHQFTTIAGMVWTPFLSAIVSLAAGTQARIGIYSTNASLLDTDGLFMQTRGWLSATLL